MVSNVGQAWEMIMLLQGYYKDGHGTGGSIAKNSRCMLQGFQTVGSCCCFLLLQDGILV